MDTRTEGSSWRWPKSEESARNAARSSGLKWHCAGISLLLFGLLQGCDREPRHWENAKAQNTVASYREFLARYPRSPFSAEAQTRMVGLRVREAETTDTPESYRSFLSESSLAAWLQEDFAQAVQWAQEQVNVQPEAIFPRYLLSLDLYFQGDYASLQEHRDNLLSREGNCARLLRWCDALLEKEPPSARAHFAQACILDHMKRTEEAAEAYRRAISMDPNCVAYRNCLEVVQNQHRNAQYSSRFRFFVEGDLQPINGVCGNFLPLEGGTTIQGAVECSYGNCTTKATLGGFSLLFQDIQRTQVIGWGVDVTNGRLLLPATNYVRMRREGPPYGMKNAFTVKAFDYTGEYVEIIVSASERDHCVIPVQIHTLEQEKIDRSGSVYMLSAQCVGPMNGLPGSVITTEAGIAYHLEGSYYLLSGESPAGFVVGRTRCIVGASNMRFRVSSGSTIAGSLDAAFLIVR